MTERKYAMIRMRRGDYLLPSNDLATLWRIYSYDEDGSLYRDDDSVVKGTFWAVARRAMPQFEQADTIDLESWDGWEFWSGPLRTRKEAVTEALRACVRTSV